jgi:hypothetical protein
MLRKVLFTLLILIAGKCYAQENYFVLIQADNNQPFYARLEDKTLSSTFQGHLILSQLKDGRYSITIGFPKQLFPEQQYSFAINGKDLELQLKEQENKGWGVLNPQTQEWLTVEKKDPATSVHIDGIKKDDAFSRLMAGVVSDTAVMYNTYAMEAALKDSPVVKPESKMDTPRALVADAIKVDTSVVTSTVMTPRHDTVITVDSARTVAPSRPTGTVTKLSERKTSKGLRLAFADKTKGRKADTVIVIIPMDSSLTVVKTVRPSDSTKSAAPTATVSPAGRQPVVNPPAGAPPTATETVSEYKSDTLHLYLGPKKGRHSTPASGAATGELYRKPDSSQKKAETKLVLVNSDCHNFATDYDVDKLRVKMLEISKDDEKIAAAKKIFRTKCFTTKQIRALSEVFTADAAKYRFFETAYPFVSDDRFRELTDLLTDPVYNSKFRAMTGQR